MGSSKGIHSHYWLKLGKGPTRHDRRNLKLSAILKPMPKLPASYDFDVKHKQVPMPMFANDRYGDCVIAGRAHQTLRFELIEQSKLIPIRDVDVIGEYRRETGGPDTGLVVLDSLNLWRHDGWKAAGRRYRISAYAQIDARQPLELKKAIYMDLGVGIGLQLPESAEVQFQTGQPWDVVGGSKGAKGSWGGHYVYCPGYTARGPVCVTWGRKQQMTWAFLRRYCDEAYAIIDAVNTAKKRRGLDGGKLRSFLRTVAPAG